MRNPECFNTGLVLSFTHKWSQVDESEIKTLRFGHVSGDFESEFKVGTLNPKTFESRELCRVIDFLANIKSGNFFACELLSLWYNQNGGPTHSQPMTAA